MAFASAELRGPLIALRTAPLGRLHRLAVYTRGAGGRRSPRVPPKSCAQRWMDLLPRPIQTPPPPGGGERRPGAVVARRQPPVTPAAQDVKEASTDPAQIDSTRASTRRWWREPGGKKSPLLLGQVRGVGQGGSERQREAARGMAHLLGRSEASHSTPFPRVNGSTRLRACPLPSIQPAFHYRRVA